MKTYEEFRGTSTKSKPIYADNGDVYFEMDTLNAYFFYDGLWCKDGASLSSIAVTTAPTKVNYKKGELLDLAGMKITATLSDSSTQVLNKDFYTSSVAEGTAITDNVTITFTFVCNGVTKTCTQAINLIELSSIAVATAPTKTAYTTDETLTMAGLKITATYDDASTEEVEYGDSRLSYSPAEESVVTESGNVTITMTHESVSKTTTQAITFSAEE